jgi:hypothetical protein
MGRVGKNEEVDAAAGGETALERALDRHLGNGIHLFLSALALLILIAAVIAAYDTVVRDFPKLWQPVSEYSTLQQIIENILLIAIAAEFGLLLLFHRPSAAVEVVIFMIARKLVAQNAGALDLLLGSAALAGLIIVRYYYIPRRPK